MPLEQEEYAMICQVSALGESIKCEAPDTRTCCTESACNLSNKSSEAFCTVRTQEADLKVVLGSKNYGSWKSENG